MLWCEERMVRELAVEQVLRTLDLMREPKEKVVAVTSAGELDDIVFSFFQFALAIERRGLRFRFRALVEEWDIRRLYQETF
jgi:hypothetical protein